MLTRRIGKGEAVLWTGLGIFICFLGWRIKIGTFRAPGPGLFALIAGLSLMVIGTLMLLSNLLTKNRDREDRDAHDIRPLRGLLRWRLVATMGLLLAYGLLLNTLGYLLCTVLVVWGLFYDWGKNPLIPALLGSLATTGATYLLFEVWLRCQLPRGIFPWW